MPDRSRKRPRGQIEFRNLDDPTLWEQPITDERHLVVSYPTISTAR